MRARLSSLPLGAWLALWLALAVAATALGAGGAWWAVSARQQADIDGRLREATALIEQTGRHLQNPGKQRALRSRLAELNVEAELKLLPTAGFGKPRVAKRAPERGGAKPAPAADGGATTLRGFSTGGVPAIAGRNAKREFTTGYEKHGLRTGPVVGMLFVQRPSGAVRLAAASAAGLLALALALIAGVILLRRWVVAPLARLAGDAERIAGGELAVAPISSRSREVAGIGAALRGMAAGLRRALAEQHAAEQQRRFLVTAIAHDLRTPLFTLRGSLEAIEHGIGDGDQLGRAQKKARLLDRLVDDLFTFSRLDDAGPELTPETIDAQALAQEAAETVNSRIGVTVVAAGPVALEGDHVALLRVLVNLLDNAARYAHSQVELRIRSEGEEVLFEVLDDGPGIAPDDLPQLFEPLFRSDRARNSATGGAGLGLAIVQRLTAAHGGSVRAENRSGAGARFVVRLPRSPRSREVAIGASSSVD